MLKPTINLPAIGLLMILMLISAAVLPAEDKQPSEYMVKAAFVYNFAKFVEWPETAFSDTNAPVIIGVVGDESKDSFQANLQQTVGNRMINGRRTKAVLISSPEDPELKSCHIVFISKYRRGNQKEFLRALKDQSTLTIGESEKFLQDGGIINFFIEEGKVRFDIDKQRAQQRQLTISSKLLNLARNRGVVQ
jgi:YfiR/HmsC-like